VCNINCTTPAVKTTRGNKIRIYFHIYRSSAIVGRVNCNE
jgi:hypothetical protein